MSNTNRDGERSVQPLRPALASIKTAREYLGGIGASKFYADFLPRLDVVYLGARTFVTVVSLDRLIEANRSEARDQTVSRGERQS